MQLIIKFKEKKYLMKLKCHNMSLCKNSKKKKKKKQDNWLYKDNNKDR